MAAVFQVGAGSGGMVVLDLLCRDPAVSRIVLVEPDRYEARNVHRHFFGPEAVGRKKVDLAAEWVRRFRPGLDLVTLDADLLDPTREAELSAAAASCDVGVCAVDNEPAKHHFDHLMRRHRKPWTLGEVLSGGIAGWVHAFTSGGACYGCIASRLQRDANTDTSPPPDYSQPGGPVAETAVPASKAAIGVIASMHALVTLDVLKATAVPFTSLLLPMSKVEGLFAEAWRPHPFKIDRTPACLICSAREAPTGEDLDAALDQALARLAHE